LAGGDGEVPCGNPPLGPGPKHQRGSEISMSAGLDVAGRDLPGTLLAQLTAWGAFGMHAQSGCPLPFEHDGVG